MLSRVETFPTFGNFSMRGPRLWIDVVAYGAVGNGVVDDTAAIAALPKLADPVFAPDDFGQFDGRALEPRLLQEQARVDRADAVAVVSPIWWLSLPAMLKGFLEQVMRPGVAFAYPEPGQKRFPNR